MFNDIVFDASYIPDEKVIESAHNLSGTAYDVANCVDRLLWSDVISIKKVTNYKDTIPEGDIVLLVTCVGWSLHKPFWFDPADPDHSIDTIWKYERSALFFRSVLILDEIDDQFGWADWIDVDDDIYTIKTADAPTEVVNSYCDEIKRDWHEFVDQWLDCGKPDFSAVASPVKNALDAAIAKYDKKVMRIKDL